MTRALSLTCLVLLAGVGMAHAKPSIAVLGLEATGENGVPSQADTQVAKELTEGLRSRAKAGMGPFMLQPGSEKELIDEKLLKNCENEAVACMSQIGTDLGADVLMYGKIEKKGGSYEVTITLLDIRNRGKKAYPTQIPVSQSTGAQIQGWAKTIYNKLTGQADSGQVMVKLSVNESGTIVIDDAPKGNITGGTGTASNVTPGKHRLVIQVGGYKDWSKEIDVKEGQTTNVGVETLEREANGPGTGSGSGAGSGSGVIEPPPPPPPPGSGGGLGAWKYAIAGTVVGLAAGGWWVYNSGKLADSEQAICQNGGYVHMSENPRGRYPESQTPPVTCTLKPDKDWAPAVVQSETDKGNGYRTQTWVGGVVVGASAAVIIGVVAYETIFAKKGSSEHASRGHKVRRDRVVVTPVISPNGGAATLQIDF